MKRFLIVLVLLAALLYATNPDKDDFVAWSKEKMNEQLKESAEENGIQEALNDVLSGVGGLLGSALTTEKNYYFFSIYTVDLGSDEYRYLGILKFFVPLQTETPLKRDE